MMTNKRIGFGFRGSMLLFYQAIAFFLFTVFGSFGQNIQASGNEMFYGWSSTRVTAVYTVMCLLSVLIQLVATKKIVKAKSVKWISVIVMALSLVFGFAMATVFVSETVWLLCFGLAVLLSNLGCTLLIGMLMGQWFPRRKGTAMGIATLAFPITGGVFLSLFAVSYFTVGAFRAYLPFLLVGIIGIVIAIVFITDYPEQCGAYRDNDRDMDPETARRIMEQEIENKKNSVWTVKNVLKCADFWLLTIPSGILLATSVGAATQIVNILSYYPDFYAKYGTLATAMVTVVACAGSWIIGILDTKLGTKKAMIIASVFAVLTGAIGFIASVPTLLVGFYMLMVFEGAASNFTVSLSAQYWKREDFASVYGVVNPVANIMQAFGPTMIIMLGITVGYHMTLGVIGVLGVIAVVLLCLVSPKRIEATDRKYRMEAGRE